MILKHLSTVHILQTFYFGGGGRNSPPVGQDFLIHEVSSSLTTTHHSRYDSTGRVINPSQRPLPDNTQRSKQTSMPPAEFEPTIPASERPQTYALDRAATRTGTRFTYLLWFCELYEGVISRTCMLSFTGQILININCLKMACFQAKTGNLTICIRAVCDRVLINILYSLHFNRRKDASQGISLNKWSTCGDSVLKNLDYIRNNCKRWFCYIQYGRLSASCWRDFYGVLKQELQTACD